MNERWKSQVSYGLIWGGVFTIIMILFGLNEKPLRELLTFHALIRSTLMTLFGIFVLGYFRWKTKIGNKQ